MALTPAEKQRQYRERQKAKKEQERMEARGNIKEHVRKAPTPDQTWSIPTAPFTGFLKTDPEAQFFMSFMAETLGSFGANLNPPLGEGGDPQWHEYDWHTPNREELGRAERIAGGFLDIGCQLYEIINAYKLREIDKAIAELEASTPSTPEEHKQALARAVQLNKIRAQLNKKERRTIPAITVKGEDDL
jgi:hypothetical protein